MKKSIASLFLLFSFVLQNQIFAQCELRATALPTSIVCGDCVTLTAFGQGQGQSVFTESFNGGAPTGWQSTSQATYNNPCSPGGVDGTTHLWMGDAAAVPRNMTTTSFDFTTASAGATICFDMLFAKQGNASPCEGPDESDEGVAVEYSIDGGNTWVQIHYFDPNGGNDASLVNWNNWCFALPPAALTANTQIRWFQDADSGAEYDHWGLDNVNVYYNDPTYEITWAHDGYSYGIGSAGGDNPTKVCPQSTTTYNVTMTNGTTTCTDQITINVTPPTFRVNAGNDTTACAGDCVTLNADAVVIKSPAKTPTYENNEFEVLATGFTGQTGININVTGLNMTNILPGSITSVCVNGLNFFGFNLFPPGQQTIGDLIITLECPDGTEILLVPDGVTTGASLIEGYSNTCFTPVSTTNIGTSASPYTGDFVPNESLDNLVGCTANGEWTMNIESNSSISLGAGTFYGWSITFDDPEISYEGDLVWSPTTDMTDETTSSPTICPTTSPVTYTITVSDTAGCTSASDDIVISLDNACCNFEMSAAVTQPACGATDGAIDITTTGGSGNFTYNWTSGQGTSADITNLGAGTYTLTITDVTQACQKDTTIILSAPNSPTITTITKVDASCGATDGSVTITATGGTGTLQYSIDGGTTFQASNSFTGLGANTYSVVVKDASGCEVPGTTTVANSAAPTITNIDDVNATCGDSNGSVTITASGGTGTLTYSIDGGTTFQASNSFTGLDANTYNLVVKDASGCEVTGTATITNSAAPSITAINDVDASCGATDGSITITATGGTGTLQYSIDGGTTFQASNSFTGLGANTYSVVVKDASGCEATGTATIANSNAPTITIINNVSATCGAADGSITITATGGTGTLQYSIDGGTTFQASNSFTGLGVNTYNVVVEDASGCEVTGTTTITNTNAPVITNITNVSANCGNSDGSITITATGGTGTLQYSIDGGTTFQASNSFTDLDANTYNVVVEDASGCEVVGTTTVSNNVGPAIDNVNVVDASCGNADGSITIITSGGTNPLEYSIDNGVTFQASNSFTALASGPYNVVVKDGSGCSVNSVANVNNSDGPTLASFILVNETCLGENNGSISVNMAGGLAPYTFDWSNGTTINSNTSLAGNTYDLTVTDANGCTFDTIFAVVAGVNVGVDLGNDLSINEGEQVTLNSVVTGSTSGTYAWTPNTDLSCADCPTPIASPVNDITYVLNYIDTPSLCTVNADITVSVIKELPFCLFPSAFSPNGDGLNDGFGGVCDNVAYFELKVYNRWGELVYKGQDIDGSLRWDGTFKGKPSPLDVFTYSAVIEYTNGTTENTSGTVTIIR